MQIVSQHGIFGVTLQFLPVLSPCTAGRILTVPTQAYPFTKPCGNGSVLLACSHSSKNASPTRLLLACYVTASRNNRIIRVAD